MNHIRSKKFIIFAYLWIGSLVLSNVTFGMEQNERIKNKRKRKDVSEAAREEITLSNEPSAEKKLKLNPIENEELNQEAVKNIPLSKENIKYISLIGRKNNAEYRLLDESDKKGILALYPKDTYEMLSKKLQAKIKDCGLTEEQLNDVIPQFFIEYVFTQVRNSSKQEFRDAIQEYDEADEMYRDEEDNEEENKIKHKEIENEIKNAQKKLNNLRKDLCEDDEKEFPVEADNRNMNFRLRLQWPTKAYEGTRVLDIGELLEKIDNLKVSSPENRKEVNEYFKTGYGRQLIDLTAEGKIAGNPGLCQWD